MVVRSTQALAPRGAFKVPIKQCTIIPSAPESRLIKVDIQSIEVSGIFQDTWDVGAPVMVVIEHTKVFPFQAFIKSIRALQLDPDDRLARSPKK